MPQAAKPQGGVVAIRSRSPLITTPGLAGWMNLEEPDNAFDSLKFKLNHHYTEPQMDRLCEQLDEHCIEANWKAFVEAAAAAGKKPPGGEWIKPSGQDWVNTHLKEPSEKSSIQLPYIVWSNDAEFKDKDGKTQRKTMRAYDADGNMLNLATLHLGMKSVVQAVLMPGLFISGLVKQPQPSLKLQGVKVIKLVQFGGGASSGGLGGLSEEDAALLGDDVEVDNLKAYLGSTETPHEKAAPKGKSTSAYGDDDGDESDLPF